MKWNKCQVMIFCCYLCAFSCFFSALFFQQLQQSLNPNSARTEKSVKLIHGARCIDVTQGKPEPPGPPKGIPASKMIDKQGQYDLTITE